jgi:adenylate cyclase class IV
MIEVEKKFRPTEEQLLLIIRDAEFLGEKTLKDLYYDYPDYRLLKNKVYLRNRNGNFELKVGDDETEGTSEEIENEAGIKNYFKIKEPVIEFIKNNLVNVIEWECKRREYKKDGFTIDIDELDFGYKCVEVELLVANMKEVDAAHEKIINFGLKNGLEIKDIPAKRYEYLRILKPEIFKEVYGGKV